MANWEYIGIEAEPLAQSAEVELEIAREVIDDPARLAARMVLHIAAKIVSAFGRRRKVRGLQYPLRSTHVVRHHILE